MNNFRVVRARYGNKTQPSQLSASGDGESAAARIVFVVSACLTCTAVTIMLSCYETETENDTLVVRWL
jgi:hypothetical protein